MAEYIERKECRDNFYASVLSILSGDSTNDRANQIIDEFDTLPAADVEPVRSGHWIKESEHILLVDGTYKEWNNFYCSECDSPENAPRKFCAECGAKMEEYKSDIT